MGLVGAFVGFPMAAGAAPPVTIQAVPNTRVATVRVDPVGSKALTIPSCRGVVWERFDERTSEYTPITVLPCQEMSPGLLLTEKGRTFEVDAPVQDGDVVRAVVVVGAKCEAGLPFELARCSQVVAVEGPTITVRGAAK
jgi:hypothetical protein